jgi:hypothetical protein
MALEKIGFIGSSSSIVWCLNKEKPSEQALTKKPGHGVAAPSLSRPMLIFYDSVQSLGALEFDEGTIYSYSEDMII